MPPWFADAVLAAAMFVAFGLVVVGVVSEVVSHFVPSRGVAAFSLAFSVTFAVPVVTYLLGAAFFGSQRAAFDTWDLLPMFVLVRMTRGIVLGAVAGVVVAAVVRARQPVDAARRSSRVMSR